jgi:hypothetical protein
MNAAIWESGYGPQLATPAVANALGASYATILNCSTTDVSTLTFCFIVSHLFELANDPLGRMPQIGININLGSNRTRGS